MARGRSIVILTQVFPPERHPTGIMVRQLARCLVERGWRVTVAAGLPHHPTGVVDPGYRKRPILLETLDGFAVVRCWHSTSRSRGAPIRGAVFAMQSLATALGGLVHGSADVVVCFGPPLVGPAAAAALARLRGAAFVNVIHDLYPDIAIETGHLESSLAVAATRTLERWQYHAAAATVVLGARIKERVIRRGAPATSVHVIPPWLDPDEITARPRSDDWHEQRGAAVGRFVVMYAGTIGVISGAAVVADAARLLRDHRDIAWVCVGDGAGKAELARRARQYGLDNIELVPFQPRADMPQMFAAADGFVMTLAPGRGRTSFPSKLLAYMAAGRPTIVAVDHDSDTADAITGGGAGIVCAPNDPRQLADAVLALRDDGAARARMGAAARAEFEQAYAAPALLERFVGVIESV